MASESPYYTHDTRGGRASFRSHTPENSRPVEEAQHLNSFLKLAWLAEFFPSRLVLTRLADEFFQQAYFDSDG